MAHYVRSVFQRSRPPSGPGGCAPSALRYRRWPLLCAFAAMVVFPSRALAGGGGAPAGETLSVVLFLMGVAIAYVLGHLVVERVQRRFLIIAGVEYVLLGLALGPAVPQLQVLGDLTGMLPVIALAAGWIGLLRGMELQIFNRDEKMSTDKVELGRGEGTLRIVMLHLVVPGALVGGVAWWFLWGPWGGYFFAPYGAGAMNHREVAAACLMLACCAASDSAEPFDVLRRRYEIEGSLTKRLRDCARISDVFVIFAFGLVFCFFHKNSPEAGLHLSSSGWFLVQIGLGAVLGGLFTPFLGGNEDANGRFLAMVGIITFAAGAAYFLDLSPLAVNVVLGVVLVNVAKTGPLMYATLRSTEKPINLVLFVLAGALWRPPPLIPTLIALGGYILLRYVGKRLASQLAAWGMDGMRNDLYRGFLAQGEVTIAMAVSFQVVFDGIVVDLAYTVALASTVLHDLAAPRILLGLLVDAGDIRREHRTTENLGDADAGDATRQGAH